jgi:hypothetical protein
MKAIYLLSTQVLAGTNFDYCSIHFSSVVHDELQQYFLEVFKGFDVPLAPTCPFSQLEQID